MKEEEMKIIGRPKLWERIIEKNIIKHR